MLKSAFLITHQGRIPCNVTEGVSKVIFEGIDAIPAVFDIEIIFEHTISAFRNHDYNWVEINDIRIATEFSPKILRLKNGCFVQANQNIGIWEIHSSNPNRLLWRFNPKDAAPVTVYSGPDSEKKIADSVRDYSFIEKPSLLFSFKNAVEFSRSPVAFSAIACFTDHCDYDTPQSLRLQRQFFNSNSIRVTKGFFLKHYSKRENNASFENDGEELGLWRQDGHELAYHSLSQSIKPGSEGFTDFNDFHPPYPDITTWIDHGYQPYNFSLFQRNKIPEAEFEKKLAEKNIETLWNYVDSGTATIGAINQLNPTHFTLGAFASGNSEFGFYQRMKLMLKNTIFHYYADEKTITAYKSTAEQFKNVVKDKNITGLFPLFRNLFNLGIPVFKVFLKWNIEKKKVYRLAKYTPLIFKHKIGERTFNVFQTVEIIDFKKALHPSNIESLIKEKGIFIAHTYFSVPMEYHQGRIFRSSDEIDPEVASNFKLLGQKIKDQEIWNPTLNELVAFLTNFEKVILDADHDGNIKVMNASGLPYRTVT